MYNLTTPRGDRGEKFEEKMISMICKRGAKFDVEKIYINLESFQ